MRKLMIIFFMFYFILIPYMGFAHELIALIGNKSQNSKRWQQEVLPEYNTSNPGQNLPIKIVPVKENLFPEWFAKAQDDGNIGEIIGTPTFLIWDSKEKKEIGRIEGYTQKIKFFSQLSEAMELIKQGIHPGKREGSGGHRDEGSGKKNNIIGHIYKTPEESKKHRKG